MIKRIFHPVGYGAFYSERHDGFNIVYDCGTKKQKSVDSVVESAFTKEDIIDILFISHFDSDHVSKISLLMKSVKGIKKVVMPLLYKEDEIFLINFYRIKRIPLLRMIQNSQRFFGSETVIIKIKHTKEIISDAGSIFLDDIRKSQTIESGTKIITSTFDNNWAYIPYNYDYKTSNTKIESFLTAQGFDVKEFKTNSKYTLKEITKARKKISDSYKLLPYTINQNSMIVYSGPIINDSSGKESFHDCMQKDSSVKIVRQDKRSACIYTGDAKLQDCKIKNIYKDYWSNVGTIQIPHHGSIDNFTDECLEDEYYNCPMSVPLHSKHKHHPNQKVINDIYRKNCCPIQITEDIFSEFIEYIKLKK